MMRNIPEEMAAAVSGGDLIAWLRTFADQCEGLHNAARKADPVHYTDGGLLVRASMLRAAGDALAYRKEHADEMVKRVVDGLKEEGDPAEDREVQARIILAVATIKPTAETSIHWGPKTIGSLRQLARYIEDGGLTLKVGGSPSTEEPSAT